MRKHVDKLVPSVTDGEKYIVQVQSTIQICQFRIILRHIYAIKNQDARLRNNKTIQQIALQLQIIIMKKDS